MPECRAPRAAAAERAKQEIDYGRRGKGYIFGAFRPATGEAFTAPYGARTTANWVDFLEQVEAGCRPRSSGSTRSSTTCSAHRATDVLLFALAHPRWEFVFQPKYARLPEPDRAVVEGAAVAGAEGPALRDLGRGLPRRSGRPRVLERPPAPVRLGPPAAPSAPPRPGIAAVPGIHDLADAPLSRS